MSWLMAREAKDTPPAKYSATNSALNCAL